MRDDDIQGDVEGSAATVKSKKTNRRKNACQNILLCRVFRRRKPSPFPKVLTRWNPTTSRSARKNTCLEENQDLPHAYSKYPQTKGERKIDLCQEPEKNTPKISSANKSFTYVVMSCVSGEDVKVDLYSLLTGEGEVGARQHTERSTNNERNSTYEAEATRM